MSSATLSATKRSESGKGAARKLRAANMVPAVVYGHHRQPQSLAIPGRELERLLERIAAETTVVELDVDGTTARTLIREIQRHPFKRQVLHVDFQELVAGETVEVNVPLVLVGTPVGVRASGGILDQIMREVRVEVDPSNIPNHIDVDVSALDLNDSLHVSDITVPAGVELLEDAESTICVVAPPRMEAEPTPAEAATPEAPAEPELIRKPKGEEGEAETEEK